MEDLVDLGEDTTPEDGQQTLFILGYGTRVRECLEVVSSCDASPIRSCRWRLLLTAS